MTSAQSGARALVVVDVQNDFVSGTLATDQGAQVAAGISELLTSAQNSYDLVVGTLDWHIDPAGHFAPEGQEPDFNETWPVHCVAEQWGSQPHENLRTEYVELWFHKGEYTAAYSGFEAHRVGEKTLLADALRERGITRIDVCGIATDFCVRATVLDGVQEGFEVTVLQNLCSPVSRANEQKVLDELAAAGAQIR